VGTEPDCDAAAGFGDVGECAVWAAAPGMPSNRAATKARAISRNRSIIGCPLTGNSLGRRLTVDGVDNKANGRFCRAGRYGDGSALVVFLNPVFRLGPFGSRTRVVSMFTSRRLSARPRSPRPVANRPHRRSNLGRSARGRSRGAITRLDVGMGYRTFLNDG